MIVGIISSSFVNEYAATLAVKLIKEGVRPCCVICAGRPGIHRLADRARCIANAPGIKPWLRGSRHTLSKCNPVFHLGRYASSQGLVGWDLPLPTLCNRERIAFFTPHSINARSAAAWVREREIDILLNAGGPIFRPPIINAPRLGILNAHMGFLPAFRGVNVLEWSLFYGHPTGVTLHFIDRGIDTGDILLFREIPVESGDTIDTLRAKSLPVNIDAFVEGIALLKQGRIERTKQRIEDGKQFFAMHPRLKALVESRLERASVGE